jgi:hypothetical protein
VVAVARYRVPGHQGDLQNPDTILKTLYNIRRGLHGMCMEALAKEIILNIGNGCTGDHGNQLCRFTLTQNGVGGEEVGQGSHMTNQLQNLWEGKRPIAKGYRHRNNPPVEPKGVGGIIDLPRKGMNNNIVHKGR